MIATLIACDHAEAHNPRLLGSIASVPATSNSGRHGPLSALFEQYPRCTASPAGEQQGECAQSPAAQAGATSEGPGR